MTDLSLHDPEATLTGDEIVPVMKDGVYRGVKLSSITPHSDHRKPRPFTGRVPVYKRLQSMDVMTQAGATYSTTVPAGGAVAWENVTDGFGTQIVRLTTGNLGIGSFAAVRRNDVGRDFNFTGKWIGIDIESPDPDKINDIQFYIGNVGLTSFYKWNNVLGSQSARPMQYGKKTRITFPLLGYSATGTPDPTTFRAWQIRIDDKGLGSAQLKVDRVFMFTPEPAVSAVCMDDGYASWFTLGKPILDKYGIRTTIYGIHQYHDSSIPGFVQPSNRLTEAHIQSFIEQGHELGFHMEDNDLRGIDAATGLLYTPTQVDAKIKVFKKWARNRFGFDVLSAAYPGGEHGYFQSDPTKTVREVFADHFPFSRSIARVFPESYPAADNSIVRVYLYQYGEGTSYTSPAINQGYLNDIAAQGGTGVWSFHELVSGTPAVGIHTQMSIADFEASMANVAAMVNAGTMESLTFREAMARNS